MQYLAVLGRQPKISLAELESLFSDVKYFNSGSEPLASFESAKEPDVRRLGGIIKIARRLGEKPTEFLLKYAASSGGETQKFTIGISDYSRRATAYSTQGEALHLKRFLKSRGFSVRVLPNKTATLSSAAVLHNKLGRKAGCFELIKVGAEWFVGVGVQDIDAYAARDFKRPARDAKVGMLPPKLAQILINLCGALKPGARVLDPFCGTGVVLQEALLMGYSAYGTDVSERMVDMTRKNLEWLKKDSDFTLATGDAADFTWEQPIDAVAFEGYLGPPMSAAPAEIKMKSVIADLLPLYYHTLRNLSRQLKPGTPVVMAVPAWLRPDGSYQRLKLLDEVEELGYNVVKYKNLGLSDLLYFREGQVVAREIIVLRKK